MAKDLESEMKKILESLQPGFGINTIDETRGEIAKAVTIRGTDGPIMEKQQGFDTLKLNYEISSMIEAGEILARLTQAQKTINPEKN